MDIHREAIGRTPGHAQQGPTDVEAYTLDTRRGLAITVWTYGATLVDVGVPDRHGTIGNVALRLPDLAAYEDRDKNPYMGATMGRYARCIAEGSFELEGAQHHVVRNEGRHHLHGGAIGFDRFVWEAEAEREPEALALRLRLHRPDGDQGYPGAVDVETVYRVDAHGRLRFDHRAMTTASTVVALTNHSYWNLGTSRTIRDHVLALNADRVLPVDEDLIPMGGPIPVAGTKFDYRAPRRIGDDRLDHSFALDDQAWAAELHDPASGRVMRVHTDQPGLQVYSADGHTEPRAGLCLQTGAWPNSPNRRDFPSSRLDPGDVYRHSTTHAFSIR